MTIFCDIDGVLRKYLYNWKEIKHSISYRDYIRLAEPIKENIETIIDLSKNNEVMLATCCRYRLLNEIWMEINGLQLPLIMTAKEKVEELALQFEIKESCLIDDKPYHIEQAEKYGMQGIYVPTNTIIKREKIIKLL